MQHLLGDVVPARIVSGGLNDLTPDFDSRLAYALNHLCVVSRCDTKTRLEKGLQRFARRQRPRARTASSIIRKRSPGLTPHSHAEKIGTACERTCESKANLSPRQPTAGSHPKRRIV